MGVIERWELWGADIISKGGRGYKWGVGAIAGGGHYRGAGGPIVGRVDAIGGWMVWGGLSVVLAMMGLGAWGGG